VEPLLIAIAVVLAALVGRSVLRERRLAARIRAVAGATEGAGPAASGAPSAVASVTTDRDRNAHAEPEPRTDRRAHDEAVDALTQGVLTVDRGLRITAANPIAHTFLDRVPGTVVGRTIIEAFLDTQVEAIVATALAQGSAAGEIGRADADGRRLLVRAQRSAAGGVWLTLEDVSELRRLQQIRAEFIDNLSHELRTPLTTVSLLAETLTRDADAAGDAIPAKMRDRIGKIEVETGHLIQMVSELVDLSRIESGSTINVVELVDLGQVATESVERLHLFADRQGVALHVEAAANLPPIRGDAARLAQVFINLLHNAVKFSPDGGEVSITVRVEDGHVVCAVADHGVGIPASAQGRIFERFYKVDRSRVRNEAGGTGLGLAIARHITERHGGTIWVESIEGAGSTFRFALPVAGPQS
jgi:two-component system phosphate regulon sensor histidine kinase PhoR